MAGVSNTEPSPYEKFLLSLPGFRGYKIRDLIKQDDNIIRSAIRMNIEKIMDRVQDEEEEISLKNPFDPNIEKYERTLSLIRTFMQELTGAPTGTLNYHVRYLMGENEIKQVMEYDYNLIKTSKDIANAQEIDIDNLYNEIKKLRDLFSKRNLLFLPESVR